MPSLLRMDYHITWIKTAQELYVIRKGGEQYPQTPPCTQVCICMWMCACVFSPESSVVQRCVSVFVLDFDRAVCLQQGLHHLHVTLVSGHLQCSLALVLDIHLPAIPIWLKIH